MPVPAFGHKTYMQIGAKETTFGTFNAPSGTYAKKLEVVSWNLSPQLTTIRDRSLWAQLSRRAMYQGPVSYKGTITVRCNYEGLKEIFRGVFGTYAATAVDTTKDDAFTEGLTLNSYSIEIAYGDLPSGKILRVVGAKFIGLTIKGNAGTGDDGMLTVDLQVIARDIDTNAGAGYTATGGLSFPTPYPVMFHQAVVVDDGTSDSASNIRMTAFEASIEQPHIEDRYYLSSLLMDEPIRSDFVVGKMKFTQEFNSMSQWLAARNFTTGSPRLVFQHPTALTTVTTTLVNNTLGQNTITRGSGSFITDGVKVGHYVANAAFPVGTYVTNVATGTVTVSNVSTAGLTSATCLFTTARELEIRMGSANLIDMSVPIDSWGRLMSTVTWEGYYDATDLGAILLRIRGQEVTLS